MEKKNNYFFKVAFAGDWGTGKSSMFVRYNLGSFPKDLYATIGVDFCKKIEKVDDCEVALQIWDQSGAERYRNVLVDENAIIVLVGNKCDLETERKVSYEEGQKAAEEYKMSYFETSAKYGININELFEWISRELKGRADLGLVTPIVPSQRQNLNLNANTTNGGCISNNSCNV